MDEDHSGLSRRKLLISVGAGAGFVWVTPVVIRVDAAGASASQEPEEPDREGEVESEALIRPDDRQSGEGATVLGGSTTSAGADGFDDQSDRAEVAGGSLARTGSDAILPLVEGGAALLGSGALLSLAARRRRPRRTATWGLIRRGARRADTVLGSEPSAHDGHGTR